MTISAETKQRFLNEILSIRFLIEEEQSRNTAESLVQFENLLTLDEIESSLISTPLTELADNLTHILSQRWERIRQSTLSYTQQPLNKANRFCFDLALALAPLPTSEDEINDLPFGKGPYFLLMPSLKAHKDIYGDNIHNLQLHEFVLSDDEQLFIPLASCLNHAFESDTGQFVHMVSETDQYPKLTPSELLRVFTHSIGVSETYQAIVTFNMHRLYGNDLGVKLNDLTIALRAGGSHGQGSGEELNAGAAANEGILAFSTYWDTVDDIQKQQYYQKYPTLENAIGRLMRPTDENYENTKFCVELIADDIDPIITDVNNNQQLLINTRNEVIAQQKLLTTAVKATNYPLLPPKAKTPKILRHIFALDEQHQKNIFKHTTHKSPLLYALENEPLALPEYIDLVKKPLLIRGIQTKLSNGDSSLIIAAKHGGSDVVELLLALGANSKALDNDGSNALHWAANNGHTNVISILLKNNKSLLKTVGANGDTALHFAVRNGQLSAVDLLIEHGADINARNNQGRNAFDIARGEYPELIKPILLKAITQILKEQRSTLSHVVSYDNDNDNVVLYVASRHPNLLNALLANVILNKQKLPKDILNSTNNKNETPLILAAKKGLNTEVQQLIQLGAKTNLSDRYHCNALHWAALEGHANVITTLLEHNNALIETKGEAGNTALNFAVMQGHSAAVNALLDKEANINARNFNHQNAIDLATQHHHHLIKPILLKAITQTRAEQKASLRNISGGIYNDVLMYAAENDPTLFKALLEDVKQRKQILPLNILNSRNAQEETLLMIAAKEGYETATQLLLELGAATDSVDKRNNNALHNAAKHGRANIVTALLEHNPALIETIGDVGNTALHYAVLNKRIAVMDALLGKDANITARNNYGYNALDLGLQNPSKLIKPLLLKALTLTPEKQTEFLSKVAYGYYDSVLTFALNSQYLNLSEIFPFLPQATKNHISAAQTEMDHFFDFDKHINPLKAKLLEMEEKALHNNDYIVAAGAANTLVHELEMARATFLLAEGGIQERKAAFKRSCLYAVESARPVLECHRNWGKVIAAFVLALVTLPISLPLYLLGFFSTKTNSAQKINKLEKEIQQSLPEPIAV